MQHEAVCRITCGGRSRQRRRRRRGGEEECSSEEKQSLSPHFSLRDPCVLPRLPRVCVCVCVRPCKAEGPCRVHDFCCTQTQSHVLALAGPYLLCRPRGLRGVGSQDGGDGVFVSAAASPFVRGGKKRNVWARKGHYRCRRDDAQQSPKV